MTVVFMSDAGLVSPARPESLLEQRRQFLWCDGDKLSTTQNGDQHEIGTLVVSGKIYLDATDVIDLAARNLQRRDGRSVTLQETSHGASTGSDRP